MIIDKNCRTLNSIVKPTLILTMICPSRGLFLILLPLHLSSTIISQSHLVRRHWLFSQINPVLVARTANGWLKQKNFIFSQFLEDRSPRSRCQQN